MNKLKNIFALTLTALLIISSGALTANAQSAGEQIDQTIEAAAEQLKTEEIKQDVVEIIDDAAANADVYKAKAYELKAKLKVQAQKAVDQL